MSLSFLFSFSYISMALFGSEIFDLLDVFKEGEEKSDFMSYYIFSPCNLLVDLEIEAGIFVNMIFFLGSLES